MDIKIVNKIKVNDIILFEFEENKYLLHITRIYLQHTDFDGVEHKISRGYSYPVDVTFGELIDSSLIFLNKIRKYTLCKNCLVKPVCNEDTLFTCATEYFNERKIK